MELYKKYRPKNLDDVKGQDGAVKTLQKFVRRKKVPHVLLFIGPSGCGKTTLAWIVRKLLKCSKFDFVKMNGSDKNGIDDMRAIRSQLSKAPIKGKRKVWLIDEAHKISSAAQDMMLDMLEDTPSHVYFMLATTDPQKLKRTIRTRCTEIKVNSLPEKVLEQILVDVLKAEETDIPQDVVNKITEVSEGSARKALVLLNQVIDLDKEKDMLASIEATTLEKVSEFIGRLLINSQTKWPEVAKLLKKYKDEDAETIRWGVLGYAKNCMLSGGRVSNRAYKIVNAFHDNFYDSKHTGLVAACYEVVYSE
jgi:DNA polymerase-3 subunit gamma/tau